MNRATPGSGVPLERMVLARPTVPALLGILASVRLALPARACRLRIG
jgi:hypothetical protein